jgi:dTDP-4-dehydrorhamnose 3,5-epimerase-like enzyme
MRLGRRIGPCEVIERMIDGVAFRELKPIPDERGLLMELMRSDWGIFEKFGQVYLTTVYPGVPRHGTITRSRQTTWCA